LTCAGDVVVEGAVDGDAGRDDIAEVSDDQTSDGRVEIEDAEGEDAAETTAETVEEPTPETSEPVGGTWFDAATGRTWEQSPSEEKLNREEAADHCAALNIGGLDDWRLPTVGELRGLIRGCDETVVGGSCGVDDSCVQASCGGLFGCLGCDQYQGPAGGCYWPAELGGNCSWYWSSTKVEGAIGGASYWAALYEDGSLRQALDLSITTNNVRCVR
jgi:hypothetical protein